MFHFMRRRRNIKTSAQPERERNWIIYKYLVVGEWMKDPHWTQHKLGLDILSFKVLGYLH